MKYTSGTILRHKNSGDRLYYLGPISRASYRHHWLSLENLTNIDTQGVKISQAELDLYYEEAK